MAQDTCTGDGCQRTARKRGMCDAHYGRWRHRNKQPEPCPVAGCERNIWSGRLCQHHYYLKRRYGSTDERPSVLGACSVDGCEKTVRTRGWCDMHLQRWYRTGTTDESHRTTTRRCTYCLRRLPRQDFPTGVAACTDCYASARQTATIKRLSRSNANIATAFELRERQGNACAICGIPEPETASGRLHVDHNHSTNWIRGLLCSNCNNGLGHFKDEPHLLHIAIAYLEANASM